MVVVEGDRGDKPARDLLDRLMDPASNMRGSEENREFQRCWDQR